METAVGQAGRKTASVTGADTEMGLSETAKLGRWHDSKRTGRPGWVVMWDGWFRLQDNG